MLEGVTDVRIYYIMKRRGQATAKTKRKARSTFTKGAGRTCVNHTAQYPARLITARKGGL